jgi:hypothetical protein
MNLSTGQITELQRYAEAELVPLVSECPRHARAAVVRFFARCTEDEVAGIPCVSLETAKRDWRLDDAWLERETGKRQ